MSEQILLTEQEAADRLRICARTLRKARKEGRLHYVLIGRAVRYTVEDLESFAYSLRQVQPPCPVPLPAKTNKARGRRGRTAEIVPFHARRGGSGRERL